jgi:hypothetical protein
MQLEASFLHAQDGAANDTGAMPGSFTMQEGHHPGSDSEARAAGGESAAQETICTFLLCGTGRFRRRSDADMVRYRRLARIVALVSNALGFLLMLLGVWRVFNLSAEDAAFGDGCGCPAPSYQQLDMLVNPVRRQPLCCCCCCCYCCCLAAARTRTRAAMFTRHRAWGGGATGRISRTPGG